ncbi:MAG: tRNA (N(6)-L-threonylcarbamoyladenosine(37)-C(2))-methylthiotransferase MtaB [Candidatus Marinimicrobia bacterium]|nr:tRNA (N(6)-L-threonylcarbamoyladenosine(37)-C(2))-methylthiotransferase MtaB [Candidatus Neomarinimicrobiota bacterium]|tara:strand:- start:553 stop:1833 length:1281 start_codon:yes stop_codon:yes gene_type:complete
MNNKVAFYTLGCKLNFSETSTIAREFIENGYQKVSFEDNANFYVLNTCTVTENANKECRKIINKIRKKNSNAHILVTGCYAQLKPKEILSIPGVNTVVSNSNKQNIFKILNNESIQNDICYSEIDSKSFFKSYSSSDRTRSFLKIQDGCDYKCTFCTIPMARGASRNQSIIDTVAQAKKIINSGVNEIVLTGVNIGDFGNSTDENFFDLLKALEKINMEFRIRISSIEPNLLTKKIIDFICSSNKIVPHLHIPLQSGSKKILKLMKRRYSTSKYFDRISYLKKKSPDMCIGADVIVGFPGEEEDDFSETYDFIKSMDLSYLHVFSYSNRDNTESINMLNQNDPQTIKKRSKILRNYSQKINFKFIKSQLFKNKNVLFETYKDGHLYGLTENYIKSKIPGSQKHVNKISEIQLVDIENNQAIGRVIN